MRRAKEKQFEEISAPDFYANMNLYPCNCKLKIKTARENTCMLSDIPDERETLQTGQGQMERQNTETAGY